MNSALVKKKKTHNYCIAHQEWSTPLLEGRNNLKTTNNATPSDVITAVTTTAYKATPASQE